MCRIRPTLWARINGVILLAYSVSTLELCCVCDCININIKLFVVHLMNVLLCVSLDLYGGASRVHGVYRYGGEDEGGNR